MRAMIEQSSGGHDEGDDMSDDSDESLSASDGSDMDLGDIDEGLAPIQKGGLKAPTKVNIIKPQGMQMAAAKRMSILKAPTKLIEPKDKRRTMTNLKLPGK